jgi:phage terminase Nu1 subunit (DNA packaging protein)
VTVSGLPIVPAESYVTRDELAELMHVSVKTIDRMVAAGMPSETWGLRSRRFLPSRALAWARTRERSEAA